MKEINCPFCVASYEHGTFVLYCDAPQHYYCQYCEDFGEGYRCMKGTEEDEDLRDTTEI